MSTLDVDFLLIGSVAILLAALCALLAVKLIAAGRDARDARRVINNLTEGVYRSSLDGRQLSANPSLVRLNGYSSEAELLRSVNSIETEWYVDPRRREIFKSLLERDGRVVDFISEIYRHKTRERIWISENARLIRDPRTGEPRYYEGTVREITETMHQRQIEERLNKLADNIPGGLFQLVRKPNGDFTAPYVSSAFFRVMGHPGAAEEVVNPVDFMHLLHPEDLPVYMESLRHSGMSGEEWRCEFRAKGVWEDSYRWLRVQATPERLTDGTINWYGFLSDISEQKEVQHRVEQLAYFDQLSGLPNRRLLMDRIDQSRAVTRRRDRHAGILFIDLDDFKIINDTHGHEVGDEFIRMVAERLQESVRESDTVARYGGDEFVVLLHDLDGDAAEAMGNAGTVARKVLAGLRQGFELAGEHRTVTCSIGMTTYKGKSVDTGEILRRADCAMYEAKRAGRAQFVAYDPKLHARECIKKNASEAQAPSRRNAA